MKILELKPREGILKNPKLNEAYTRLGDLLNELRTRDLPQKLIKEINSRLEVLNAVSDTDGGLNKVIAKTQAWIIRLVEKQIKVVPKNYYRNIWLALGLASIGIPLGVAFGLSMGNMAMMAIGIPIGLVIGLGVGMTLDKKAHHEGRQLEFEA